MRKDKVVFDFRRISVPKKIAFGRFVISKMSTSDLFTKPYVTYEESLSTVNKLGEYYLSSRDGSHTQIALMHQAKEEYDEVFRKLARYVDREAGGDAAIIVSSGFNLVKQPKPRERMELRVERTGISGTVKLRRAAVDKATAYVWQYYVGAKVPLENEWLFGGCSTQASFKMTGLTSGSRVWFRVAAVTRDGMQAFTQPVMKVVL